MCLSTNVACDSHKQNAVFWLVQCNASNVGIELKSIRALHDATTQLNTTISVMGELDLTLISAYFHMYMYM